MESKKKMKQSLSIIFDKTKILDPTKGEYILFKSLWENNTKPLLLINWLRRFGWSLCRLGAYELTSTLNEASEEIKNKLNWIAIGLAKLDYENFVKDDYFKNGLIYLDEKKETYKSLNFTSMGLFSGFGMLNPKVYLKSYEASKKGISGNLQGDGTQLGGLIIVNSSGEVIFSHVQKNYTDQPDINEIIKIIENYNS